MFRIYSLMCDKVSILHLLDYLLGFPLLSSLLLLLLMMDEADVND